MKTKHLLYLAFLLVGSTVFAQPALPSSDAVLNKAYAEAASGNKKVILIFHASWCGWCKKMTASLNDPLCKKMFDDNYVITYLDVMENKGKENLENPGSLDVIKKYKGEQAGLPFWLILDAKGNVLANSEIKAPGATEGDPKDNVGCPSSEKEVAYFTSILKATSKLNDMDLKYYLQPVYTEPACGTVAGLLIQK